MYNFEVGDYVKYRDRLYPRMGVVVKIEEDDDVVSVFFRYPDSQTKDVYGTLLTKATLEEYAEYVDDEEDKIARKLMNPALYNFDADEKSFDQALDEILDSLDEACWFTESEVNATARYREVKEILSRPYVDNRQVVLGGHEEWQEALKQAYIDMALDTQDWEWLKELTKGE